MSPLHPSFHQTPLLSNFLVCPFGTVNPTLADRSRRCFIFIRPPRLYFCFFIPWLLLFHSTALCGRHLLLSVATKVSKSALLFHHRSTNKSAVAVNFSAITFVWNYPSFSSVWLLLKQPCALQKNSHYYSSALLKQLTNRFDKNNLSTSIDRYRPWCTPTSVMV